MVVPVPVPVVCYCNVHGNEFVVVVSSIGRNFCNRIEFCYPYPTIIRRTVFVLVLLATANTLKKVSFCD